MVEKCSAPRVESAEKKSRCLWVLFGPPGAGKNFVGEILADKYGFAYHDSDTDFPDEMKEFHRSGNEGLPPSEIHRIYIDRAMTKASEFMAKFDKVAVSITIGREIDRQYLTSKYPEVCMVFVFTTKDIAFKRIDSRKGHNVNPERAKNVHVLFEPPQILHYRIDNLAGKREVVEQIDKLL